MDLVGIGILATMAGGCLAAFAMLYQLGHAALNALALYDLAIDARELHERYQRRLASLRGEPMEVDVIDDTAVATEEGIEEAVAA